MAEYLADRILAQKTGGEQHVRDFMLRKLEIRPGLVDKVCGLLIADEMPRRAEGPLRPMDEKGHMIRDVISNPLDIVEGDFLYREQAEHYAARFGTDVVTRITLVTTDGADEAGYYARCAAHFANIYLRMEGSWANVRGSV